MLSKASGVSQHLTLKQSSSLSSISMLTHLLILEAQKTSSMRASLVSLELASASSWMLPGASANSSWLASPFLTAGHGWPHYWTRPSLQFILANVKATKYDRETTCWILFKRVNAKVRGDQIDQGVNEARLNWGKVLFFPRRPDDYKSQSSLQAR